MEKQTEIAASGSVRPAPPVPEPRTNADLLMSAANQLVGACDTSDAARPLEDDHTLPRKVIDPLPAQPRYLPDLSLEPERLIGPEAYILENRKKGIDDITTIEHMENHGWNSQTIADALEHTRDDSRRTSLPSPWARMGRSPFQGPRLLPAALSMAVIIIAFISVGAYILPHQSEPSVAAETVAVMQHIVNKDYQITLPAGWAAADSNSADSSMRIYIQSRNASVQKSHMTIAVTPAGDKSLETPMTALIDNLRNNGGIVEVISKETMPLNGHAALLQTTRAQAGDNPSDVTYYICLSVLDGSTAYSITTLNPPDQWQQHSADIVASLKTFRPVNKSPYRAQ